MIVFRPWNQRETIDEDALSVLREVPELTVEIPLGPQHRTDLVDTYRCFIRLPTGELVDPGDPRLDVREERRLTPLSALPAPCILFDSIDGPSHVHANGDPSPCPNCPSERGKVVLASKLDDPSWRSLFEKRKP